MRIGIVAFDGFDELDVVGPLEVFRRAAALGADLTAEVVTRTDQDTIVGSVGLSIVPDVTYETGDMDVLVVAGGGWIDRADTGVWGEVQRGDWLPLLSAEAAVGTTMLSVCAGAMLLAHAGVIGTRRATTHQSALEDLAETGATVVRERVVDDGDLITSGGVTSGLDLALWFVGREFGESFAQHVADVLEYERYT